MKILYYIIISYTKLYLVFQSKLHRYTAFTCVHYSSVFVIDIVVFIYAKNSLCEHEHTSSHSNYI